MGHPYGRRLNKKGECTEKQVHKQVSGWKVVEKQRQAGVGGRNANFMCVPPRAAPDAVKNTIASRSSLMLAARDFLCSGVSLVSLRDKGIGLNWSRGTGNLLMSKDFRGILRKGEREDKGGMVGPGRSGEQRWGQEKIDRQPSKLIYGSGARKAAQTGEGPMHRPGRAHWATARRLAGAGQLLGPCRGRIRHCPAVTSHISGSLGGSESSRALRPGWRGSTLLPPRGSACPVARIRTPRP